MQADRNLDGSQSVATVDHLLNQFAHRHRDAIKAYEAWRVKQQLRTSNVAHVNQLKQHAAEVLIYLFIGIYLMFVSVYQVGLRTNDL